MLLIKKKKKKTNSKYHIPKKTRTTNNKEKSMQELLKPNNKMTQKYKIRLMGFGIAKENPFQKKKKNLPAWPCYGKT